MAAYDTGKMILFIRSVLWDLNVPQEAATILFEDNDACTAMGNAQILLGFVEYCLIVVEMEAASEGLRVEMVCV